MPRLLLLALALLVAPAAAQDAPAFALDAPRVLHTALSPVKGPDGPTTYRFTTTYDPASGEYVRSVVDETSGEVVKREVLTEMMTGPTPEEAEMARHLIETDPELSGVMKRAEFPVQVQGGFPLVREVSAGFCGPGSRCFQYDIFETIPGQKAGKRLRYVVVDMRTGDVVARDLDPAWESNLANPAIRRDSRARNLTYPSDSQ